MIAEKSEKSIDKWNRRQRIKRNPPDIGCVVPRSKRSTDNIDGKVDDHKMMVRRRSLNPPDDPTNFDIESGFLDHLAPQRRNHRLAEFNPSSGNRPLADGDTSSPLDEQQLPVADSNPADAQFRAGCHGLISSAPDDSDSAATSPATSGA